MCYVEVIEENGELLIPIPEDMLEELGWKPEDTLVWLDNKDGSFSIKKFVDVS